jgi:hypothetical protein
MGGACSTDERNSNFWSENMKERDPREIGVEGKLMLEWILGKYGGRLWTGFIWLRIGTNDGPCSMELSQLVKLLVTAVIAQTV